MKPPIIILSAIFVFPIAMLKCSAAEAPVIPLWPDGAPGSEGRTERGSVRIADSGDHIVTDIHEPTLTLYLPSSEAATGAAVVVMPGGGHRELWTDHEGYDVGRWFQERGVAAFVLHYRLARAEDSPYSLLEHSLADAKRAVRLVRHNVEAWNIDPARVGVMGFSAGGELAALIAMDSDAGEPGADDVMDRQSCQPDFQILVYPGQSQNIQPTENSPPAFLVCGLQDRPDISEGLAEVYLRFKKLGASVELHIYADAGHGFGLRETNTGPVAGWLDRTIDWMKGQEFLGSP